MSSIITRARSIHQTNTKKLSLIPDLSLSVPSENNFMNDEGGCVLTAAKQYSTDAPLRQVFLAQGADDVFLYDLETMIPGWNDRYEIEMIEYPLDLPQMNFMDNNCWDQSVNPATMRSCLWFSSNFPGGNGSSYYASFPSGSFGIWYMRPHIFDTSTNLSSIPDWHEEAVSQLAASLFMCLASNIAAQFSDKTSIENKDLGGLSARIQGQADKAKAEYDRIIGKDQVAFGPQVVGWEVQGTLGWMPFHPARSSLSR